MENPATATTVTSSLWSSLNSWFTSTVLFLLLNLMIATIFLTSNLPTNDQPTNQEDEQKQNPQHDGNQPQIARSPSLLHRLKSFNFHPQKSQIDTSDETHYHPQPLELAATQYVFNQPVLYQHFDFDSTNSDQLDAEFQLTDTETRVESVTTTRFDFDTVQETPKDSEFGFDFEPDEEEHNDEFESLDEVYSKLKGGGHDRTKSESELPPKAPAKMKMKKSASLKVGYTHLEEEEEEEENLEARRPATVKVERAVEEEDDDVEVDSRADDFINKFKNDLKLQRIESIMKTKALATNRGTGK